MTLPVAKALDRAWRRESVRRLSVRAALALPFALLAGWFLACLVTGTWRLEAEARVLFWLGGALLAGTLGLVRHAPWRRTDARFVEQLDRATDPSGAVVTARRVPGLSNTQRYAPLVAHRLRSVALGVFPAARSSSARVIVALVAAVLIVVGSLLTSPLAAGTQGGEGASATSGGDAITQPEAAADDDGEAIASGTELADLVAVGIATARRIYLANEFIDLESQLRVRAGIGRRIRLQAILLVADGSLSPDRGFGPGVRPVVLPEPLELPAEASPEPHRWKVALDEILDALGMRQPGIITLEMTVFALGDAPDLPLGGAISTPWTIRIADNRSSQKAKQQAPTEPERKEEKGQEPEPESQSPEDQDPQSGGEETGPELGAPEDLGPIEANPEAVEAEVGAGPEIEKQVKVFERQRGPGAPPPPAPPRIEVTPSELEKQAREAFKRKDLPPRERRLLEAYFERLRGGR